MEGVWNLSLDKDGEMERASKIGVDTRWVSNNHFPFFLLATVLTIYSFLCHANQDGKGGSRKVVVMVTSIVSSVVAMVVIFAFIY
ncbi:hypothetical protein E2542_SST09505 [Spatholobus suberectus]|nr:hypothetical protein E2542_SST09505 [Spatholobus suberectus]